MRLEVDHLHLSPILGEITAIPNLIEILQDIRTKYKNIKGLSFYTNAILLDRFDIQTYKLWCN